MACIMSKVVDKDDAAHERNQVVAQVDLDVVDVMVAQGLLAVVERCLGGTEEVANPSDVEYVVDDVNHSFDGVVDVHLVHDVLLNFDVELFLDDFLDDFLCC